jgi:MFS family permease
MSSVTLASGASQIMDSALTLFAGTVLGLTATQTDALLAAGLATSFLLRPLGGVAADRDDRATIAAVSALVVGAGYALVASAGAFPVVLAGVLLSRAGGAFLWVDRRRSASGGSARVRTARVDQGAGGMGRARAGDRAPRGRLLRADLRRGGGVCAPRRRAPRLE